MQSVLYGAIACPERRPSIKRNVFLIAFTFTLRVMKLRETRVTYFCQMQSTLLSDDIHSSHFNPALDMRGGQAFPLLIAKAGMESSHTNKSQVVAFESKARLKSFCHVAFFFFEWTKFKTTLSPCTLFNLFSFQIIFIPCSVFNRFMPHFKTNYFVHSLCNPLFLTISINEIDVA